MATWSCSGNMRFDTLTELPALIHDSFRILGFLSVPASSDRLGAARRQGQYAVKGSGARGVRYLR